MKKIYSIAIIVLCFSGASCELDLYPTGYSEHNIEATDDGGSQYTTKTDIKNQLDAMYTNMKDNPVQEFWMDWLVITDTGTDNAYHANFVKGVNTDIETHQPLSSNSVITRDWNYLMTRVNAANQVISYIDDINDPELTDTERRQWKAEALIWRAYSWLQMSQLWGDIPMVEQIPPPITAENVEEVYPLYYPGRVARQDAHKKILSDLRIAIKDAPDIDPTDKFRCNKAFGLGVMARLFAEEPLRNYEKVDSCCTAIEEMNLSLVNDYGDLWSWNADKSGMRMPSSSESLFEVTYTKSSGNWVWMMFWRNGIGSNLNESFTWAKWTTPSRNLVAAFEAEGDTERMNETIIWDQCGWSNYYEGSRYAFMYKIRCNASSIILMRLAEIYLLHAEALTHLNNLADAKGYVDIVRDRAGLNPLPAVAAASKEAMLNAILKERRLELAFEGHRWFDLIRFGKAIACVNNINNPASEYYDSRKIPITPIDGTGYLMPVPQTQIDNNPNLEQNPGY
jgi:hypothetical protein